MKKNPIILMAVMALLLTATTNSYAQGCCGSGGSCNKGSSNSSSSNPNKYAMNGGTAQQVGKYNIEMVFQPMLMKYPITFYLMNKKGKPVNDTTITGKAEFTFEDASSEKLALECQGENGYAAQLKDKAKSFVCLVTFHIKGENITARFENVNKKPGDITAKAIYTCPMHSEVQSDKPDNCPKCGMALVKK